MQNKTSYCYSCCSDLDLYVVLYVTVFSTKDMQLLKMQAFMSCNSKHCLHYVSQFYRIY